VLILRNKINVPVRPILVTIITTLTIFTFLNMIPPANANPCTDNPCPVVINYTVSTGTPTIYFRDINSTDNSAPSISLDQQKYRLGQIATATINDFNENLNPFAIDTITATVEPSGSNFTLSENGLDTGVFVGNFIVPNNFNGVSYPATEAPGRAKLTLDVGTGGKVLFSDYIFTPANSGSLPFQPLTQAVNFTLSGVTLGSGVRVNMTWNNAPLGAFSKYDIQMCYQPHDGLNAGVWQIVTLSDNDYTNLSITDSFHDFNSNTITDDNVNNGGPQIQYSGLVVPCANWGTGFGGGLVGVRSAGIIPFALAGLAAITGNTVSPPSFGGTYYHYSDGLTFTQGNTKTTFDTSKYNQDLQKQVMVTGQPVNMTFKTFEGYNRIGVVHMGLYIIPRGQDMVTSNSLASITWDKGQKVDVNDPNHILSNATASSDSDGKFQYTKFSFVPTKSYDKMSFLARAWNDHLQSTDVRVHDEVDTPPPPYEQPYWLHVYDNLHDADIAIEGAGFAKPHIFSHVSTSDQVWNQNGGTVLWFWDTKDQAVAMEAFDSNKNVVWIQSELLSKETSPITQGPEASYAGNHLNRQDTTALENAQKAEQDRVDTTLQMLGYPVYWNHSIEK